MPRHLQSHPLTQWLEARGWFYHPHQLETLELAEQGRDVLLFAPTGSGKTLSGFLPSIVDLTRKDPSTSSAQSASFAQDDNQKEAKQVLHTLYISPLKALATDVQRNLLTPIEEIGLEITVETRTGDTPAARRQRQKDTPPDMLMTTPESLALLLSYETAADYFKDLKYIVIDELHAIMHSKRGDLLSLGLARLETLAPNAQRIGLSATVAEPEIARDYLCRKGKGEIIEVHNPTVPEIDILLPADKRMPWSGHMATYASEDIYARIKQAKMSVVFVNTRAQAELMFQELWKVNDDNLRIAVHHGSLERELRRKVEAMMTRGELDCVVATASLDLGLDWADVDLVVQIGAPKGVSRLLQRVGRSNHRMDEPSAALLVPASRFEYLECLAAKSAIEHGQLDGAGSKRGGLDVLAQHMIGTACSDPLHPDAFYKEVIKAWPYRDLTRENFDRVLEFAKNGGYALQQYERFAKLVLCHSERTPDHDPGVVEESGQIPPRRQSSTGSGRDDRMDDNIEYRIANKKVVQQYRMNIGTIVEAHMLKVKLNMRTIGKIEEWFVQGLSPGDTFLFGGMMLKYLNVSDQGVQVAKATGDRPRIPSYAGGRMPLSSYLSGAVRHMLNTPQHWKDYPRQVQDWLTLQKKRSVLPSENGLLVETFPHRGRPHMVVYAFAGRNAHQTLGFLLLRRLQRLGYKPTGFVGTDYALALTTLKPVDDVAPLFTSDLMGDELHEWLQDTPLLKRNFRDAAVISGLIERRYPGQQKTGKQVTFSTDLIYDVLRKYEPDHILLQAAIDDAYGGLIDLGRLSELLARVQDHVTHKELEKVSPLAVPLILEISRETINKKDLGEFYLEEFEAELLEEAGLS